MSWLRRLSRDRSSKGEADLPMPIRPGSYHTPPQQQQPMLYKDTQYSSTHNSQDRLQSYRAPTTQESQFNSLPLLQQQRPPGSSHDATMSPLSSHNIINNNNNNNNNTMTSAPDPLTKAFNEALRPYVEQIENLKQELEDTTLQLQQLEDERADMHAWIDKRGLRAGK